LEWLIRVGDAVCFLFPVYFQLFINTSDCLATSEGFVEQLVKCTFVKIEKNAFKVIKMNSVSLDFELSKVVPFIKSRKTR